MNRLERLFPCEQTVHLCKSKVYLLTKSIGHVASSIFYMAVSTTGSVTESQDTEGMRPTQPAPVIYLNCLENVLKLRLYYYYFFNSDKSLKLQDANFTLSPRNLT